MLSEEVKEFIGKGGEARVFEVEKGAIRRFADAVDDPNPLFRDDEHARNSQYGAIIARRGSSAGRHGCRAARRWPAALTAAWAPPSPRRATPVSSMAAWTMSSTCRSAPATP